MPHTLRPQHRATTHAFNQQSTFRNCRKVATRSKSSKYSWPS